MIRIHISPVPAPEDAALMESRRVGAVAAQHNIFVNRR
ncbi:hypothetical protein SS05631_a48740 (plasmid) [Sinorhizobium sp. CCBAU 05631]|nr:hypothetical protein SS05631_a48740 [Sinorhizobium sp. CCBAU 05631]